jgi:exosome complex component RRP42
METSRLTGERIKQYLAQGKRFDGRKPDEFRKLEIEIGVSKNAEGSARVKLGSTEVIVGVKMGIAEPYPDSPDKGNLMVTAELSPISSARFESGPPKFPAIELARIVDRGIRESKVIESEKLCIKKGEKVWNVFIDIYPINADGNLIDAAGIGAMIALKNAKMPKYDEKEEKVLFGEHTIKNLPLAKDLVIPITFYKIGEEFLIDPTQEEEDVSEARITIGSANGFISSMQKGGKEVIKEKEMFKVLDTVDNVCKDMFKKIEKFLK